MYECARQFPIAYEKRDTEESRGSYIGMRDWCDNEEPIETLRVWDLLKIYF